MYRSRISVAAGNPRPVVHKALKMGQCYQIEILFLCLIQNNHCGVAYNLLHIAFIRYLIKYLQGSAKRRATGLVNFVTAVAYHFCLSLPAPFTQPEVQLLAELCI